MEETENRRKGRVFTKKRSIMKTETLGRLREEEGQSLVEYALILVLVAAVVVIGLTAFGGGVVNLYQAIVTAF